MTYSILTYDEETGIYAGACATGSLCVGGWVLRGAMDAGLVASQGTAPSTFWRDDTLRAMRSGESAENAVNSSVSPDAGRAHRQLCALDRSGRTAGFTGGESVAWSGHSARRNLVVAGNMLAGEHVLEALRDGFEQAGGVIASRLLMALKNADQAGGDSRGLLSAAMLVLSPDAPPLDLRIDHATAPLDALDALLERAGESPYADWLDIVPVTVDRFRAPGTDAKPTRANG